MRRVRYIAAIVLLLIAGLWGATRIVPRWQARQLTPVMTAYLGAAAAGDSVALTRVTDSPAPVRWALLVRPLDNVQGRFLRGSDSVWRLLSASVPIC